MSTSSAAPAGPPACWLAAVRRLLGEPTLTGPEVAAAAGCSYEDARRLWQAMGLPPVPPGRRIFTDADVTIVRGVTAFMAEADVEPAVVTRITRVMGRSMAQVAEAFLMALRDRIARDSPSGSETVDERLAASVMRYVPATEPVLLHVWRHELLAGLLRLLGAVGERGEDHAVAVGFADLAGFTALAQQLDDPELAALVERFETLAYARIVERGGRVVKMIGDEILFAADDPNAAGEIALALVEACEADPLLPPLRVGVALGPVLAWEGDVYGPTVNLASRLVTMARPGTVLVSHELGLQVDSARFVCRRLGPVRLRGIGPLRLWVLRRPAAS